MEMLSIHELVPFVAGAIRVVILGPGSLPLASVQASAHPPTVTLTAPNGGEVLTGDAVTLSWQASDADNDPLSFIVQHSPDNGATWQVVYTSAATEKKAAKQRAAAQASGVFSVTVDAGNFVAGDQGLIRLWVSDGLHTVSDQSDAPFRIPNHVPEVTIVQPANDTTIFIQQSLGLEAIAYDVDGGSMESDQVQWLSNLDGVLGNGAQLTTASLSAGTHLITVRADDGQGGVATASVTVIVRGDLADPVITQVFLPLILR